MFDYFLRFSAFLADLTGAECEWLQEQLAIVYIVDGVEYPEGELPEGKTEADATWIGCRAYLGWDGYEPDPADEVGFLYSFADKPDKAGRWFLHLYATQSGNVGNVAYVVQKFLKRFRPADSWFLTFCVGSDRAGVGEFGGGAVFVTASVVESFTVEDWATGRVREFENRTATKRRPRVVLNVSGGAVQDVYCSDPETDVVIVDWDTEGCDPDADNLVGVAGGPAYVTNWDAEPLAAMKGTDVDLTPEYVVWLLRLTDKAAKLKQTDDAFYAVELFDSAVEYGSALGALDDKANELIDSDREWVQVPDNHRWPDDCLQSVSAATLVVTAD